MIQARELRIGNLILMSFENSIETVTARTIGFINQANYKGHNHPFEPIPLTEEWLVKLGFVRNGKVWEIDSINGIVFEIEYVSDCYYLHTYGEWGYQGFLYVHQLQNLYKALTGQELNLSE